MVYFKRLSLVGVLNHGLCTLILIMVIFFNFHLLRQLDECAYSHDDTSTKSLMHAHDMDTDTIDHKPSNNIQLDMHLKSLASRFGSTFTADHDGFTDCVVFLSDARIINSTLGAIYNIREPSLGNWSECIIVMGNDLNSERFPFAFQVFECLNVYHFDITDDAVKERFPHIHYWKALIFLHPFFREQNKLRYVMYLDSDCITMKPIRQLIERSVQHIRKNYGERHDHIWLAWREDYRHNSMYKAVLSLDKYDADTLTELKREYPDYVHSKQGNVMLMDVRRLPAMHWFDMEIDRIMNKYAAGFWRNDQSLFNLMFYHNSSDLGWTAFTNPPSEQLFSPPDQFPMVHTGGHQAMAIRRPKEERGGIKREPETAVYHALWEFWMHKLIIECPQADIK